MAELPVALYRAPVSAGALVVLTRLWAHASAGVRWVHPSVRRLQDELGLANGTVYRRLSELSAAGLIVREWGESQGGRRVQGWTLADLPPVGMLTSHGLDGERADAGGRYSQGQDAEYPTDGRHDRTDHLPPMGIETSHPRESRPPTDGNPISTGSSHGNLPQEASTARDLKPDDGTSLPPTHDELKAWQADDPPGFALSSPEPAAVAPKLTAEQRRQERALGAWEAYERRRREAWPKARGRQVTDADVRRVVTLHKHIRKRRGLDDDAAWIELEAYGQGSIDHALAAEQGVTGDSPEWAARLVRWRGDGGEWGAKRYEAWAAGGDAKPTRARRRGHARAEDQDHSEGRF